MQVLFRFAYPYILGIGIITIIAVILFKKYWQKHTVYKYPLLSYIVKHTGRSTQLPSWILYLIRLVAIIILALLAAKPQLIDQKSKVSVEGIDIVVTLDVSGSMLFFDDLKDQRTRIDVAKKEAIRFIKKRENDSIALVNFGKYALTRCPLTQDKKMLVSSVEQIKINASSSMANGTVLSQAIVAAARRLQKSKAKSKVIILLTDGEPSVGDMLPEDALSVAQKFGIKIYTIGIGGDGGLIKDPFFGVRRIGEGLRKDLLIYFAEKTGGKFFEAKKPQDLAKIYDEIDALEKTQYEADVYAQYLDYFMPFIWVVIFLLLFELCVTTFVWTVL